MSEIQPWKVEAHGSMINLKRGYDLPTKYRTEGEYPIYSSSGISGFHNEFRCEPPGVIGGVPEEDVCKHARLYRPFPTFAKSEE